MANKTKTEKQAGIGAIQIFMAVLAYLWILFIIPLILKRKDDFVHFHAKQGLVFFLVSIAVGIFMLIPFIGVLLGTLIAIVLLIFWTIAIAHAVVGKKWLMPIIGAWSERLDI